MSASTVRRAWEAIEAALDEATARALRPPVSAARLAKAAAVLGPLPAPLRTLLARHDGMRDTPLYLNVRLLPSDEIVKVWRMRVETGKSVPYKWSRDWVPITDADGDHVCLDRKTGRIIAFANAGARARVVAPSLLAWLRCLPRYIRAERNEDTRRAELLPGGPRASSKREREKQAKVDGELGFFLGFVQYLESTWKGPAPLARVLDYRAVSRARAAEVLARSLELGHVTEVGGGLRMTAKGRRFRHG